MTTKKKVSIAVMGVTGSGKSTFIQTASELNVDVGHDLESCTEMVQPYTFEHGEYEITLIDTPGFNDTFRSETTVLKNIASWLDLSYRNFPHERLSGIIYMQAITDRKMYGSTLRNLKMFRELCGESPLKNVILVTTGWGTAAKSGHLQKATDNERQLRTETQFWANMIKRGSDVKKFEDSRESAMDIIFSLVDKPPVVLQIQEELVDKNKNLADTAAGHVVNEELKKVEAAYRAELDALAQQMTEAQAKNDKELQEVLEESKREISKMKADARRAQDDLHYENRNQQRRMDQRIEDLQRELHNRDGQTELQLKAQHIEDRLQFEGIVAELKANQSKVREEERRYLEDQIREMQKQGKKGAGTKLLLRLTGSLGGLAMSVLGFPMLAGGLGAALGLPCLIM